MSSKSPRRFLGLRSLLAAIAVCSTAHAAEPAAGPFDAEAHQLVQKVWDSRLRTCGTSAFESLDGRVLIELDHPQFHIAPTDLTDAAKQSGYEYQTTAILSARRWRWAHQGGGSPKWTPWQEGQDIDVRRDNFGISRAHTLAQDGVLQFVLVRKDGAWKAQQPISPLNVDPRDVDFAALSATPANVPPCPKIAAPR